MLKTFQSAQPAARSEIASRRKRVMRIVGAALAGGALYGAAWLSPALAQMLDCGALQAQIARAGQPSGNAGRYLAAANQQRSELARTQAYAQSIGCGRRQFLIFGSPPPPQCGGLEQRIAAMQANLSNLQAQVQVASGGGRAELVARYNAYCRNQQSAVLQPRSLFEQLFGPSNQYERLPISPGLNDDLNDDERRPRGGSTAICVRTCDGGFFPVSYGAGQRDLGGFADLCRALCPNAETEVYRFTNGGNIEDAINDSGDSYTRLPNAGKFKKTFDSTCTCKPANKTWAEVLEGAEKLLGSRSRDLIVTPEKAEELSRPRAARQTASAQAAATQRGNQPQASAASLTAVQQEAEKQDAATGESVPTAGSSSAGIEGGRATSGGVYGVTDGVRQETKDTQGRNRKVRVIGPTL